MINLEDGKIEIDLTKFLKDVKNIQALPDKPTESASILKQLFDKAGEDIKNYINNELIEEIKEAFTKAFESINDIDKKETEGATKLKEGREIQLTGAIEGMKGIIFDGTQDIEIKTRIANVAVLEKRITSITGYEFEYPERV